MNCVAYYWIYIVSLCTNYLGKFQTSMIWWNIIWCRNGPVLITRFLRIEKHGWLIYMHWYTMMWQNLWYWLTCDSSSRGVGDVSWHVINEVERPIGFVSKILLKGEQNYSQLYREALDIYFCFITTCMVGNLPCKWTIDLWQQFLGIERKFKSPYYLFVIMSARWQQRTLVRRLWQILSRVR